MKSIKRARLLGAVTAGLLVASLAPAAAYQTWNDHRLTYGVTNQQYWIASGAASNYATGINNAVAAWNATATPVSYTRTTVQSNSRLDWTHPSVDNGACAEMKGYVNTTEINVTASDWWWAKIQIRPVMADTGACGPADHRRGVFGHEMGHAMGLAHVVGGADRIMQRDIAFPQYYGVNTPQPDDVAGINYLY